MTEQDQIKALSELEAASLGGEWVDFKLAYLNYDETRTEHPWIFPTTGTGKLTAVWKASGIRVCLEDKWKNPSYDAIIPLIQKWCDLNEQWDAFIEYLWDYLGITSDWSEQDAWKALFRCNPAQLSEALLRATGKWKESAKP